MNSSVSLKRKHGRQSAFIFVCSAAEQTNVCVWCLYVQWGGNKDALQAREASGKSRDDSTEVTLSTHKTPDTDTDCTYEGRTVGRHCRSLFADIISWTTDCDPTCPLGQWSRTRPQRWTLSVLMFSRCWVICCWKTKRLNATRSRSTRQQPRRLWTKRALPLSWSSASSCVVQTARAVKVWIMVENSTLLMFMPFISRV